MNRPRLIRGLRIAWSGWWGILTLLLVILWWRSYWKLELVNRCNGNKIMTTIGSQMGSIYIAHFDAYQAYKGTGNSYASHGWTYRTLEANVEKDQFVYERGPSSLNIVLPHWCFVLISALLCGGAWLRRSFSLGTLLIANTLVAVILGLAVYATR